MQMLIENLFPHAVQQVKSLKKNPPKYWRMEKLGQNSVWNLETPKFLNICKDCVYIFHLQFTHMGNSE